MGCASPNFESVLINSLLSAKRAVTPFLSKIAVNNLAESTSPIDKI